MLNGINPFIDGQNAGPSFIHAVLDQWVPVVVLVRTFVVVKQIVVQATHLDEGTAPLTDLAGVYGEIEGEGEKSNFSYA
ncbi:MAG: hypothetical protein DHS20C18_40760 [Saprospiraceae bacterium]|nr:MAG: hypothetical protein DHS20C18_40760 [Saprospiraceae bacterium]